MNMQTKWLLIGRSTFRAVRPDAMPGAFAAVTDPSLLLLLCEKDDAEFWFSRRRQGRSRKMRRRRIVGGLGPLESTDRREITFLSNSRKVGVRRGFRETGNRLAQLCKCFLSDGRLRELEIRHSCPLSFLPSISLPLYLSFSSLQIRRLGGRFERTEDQTADWVMFLDHWMLFLHRCTCPPVYTYARIHACMFVCLAI